MDAVKYRTTMRAMRPVFKPQSYAKSVKIARCEPK